MSCWPRFDTTSPRICAKPIRASLPSWNGSCGVVWQRMSDRYQAAAEVIDDLTAFISTGTVALPAAHAERDTPVVVVPKGLHA